jgi:hypothetical protein
MSKDNKYANRQSYFEVAEHTRDNIRNYGFDYHGKLFQRSVSKVYFDDEKKSGILSVFDGMISYIIDYIKMIKKSRNYAVKKTHVKMR